MGKLKQALVATDDNASASGVITYWTLGGTASYEAVRAAWKRAGMLDQDLIRQPSALVALRRAIEHVTPDGCIIKPLKDEDGYTVIRKTKEVGAAQKWETEFSAYVAESGKLTVFVEENSAIAGALAQKLAGKIEDALEEELGTLHSIDISVWLVKLADKVQAVSLRDSGGFYFIPRGVREDYWNVVANVLKENTAARVMTIPAMTSEQCTLAVVQGLSEEINKSTASMHAALQEARMGKRAMTTKIDECGHMIDKIGAYEQLLGKKLTELREAVDTLKAKYVEAWRVEEAQSESDR